MIKLLVFDFHGTLFKESGGTGANKFRNELHNNWKEGMILPDHISKFIEERSPGGNIEKKKQTAAVIWNIKDIKKLKLYDSDIIEVSKKLGDKVKFAVYSAAEFTWFIYALLERLFKGKKMKNPFDPDLIRSADINKIPAYAKYADLRKTGVDGKTVGLLTFAEYLNLNPNQIILIDDDQKYQENLEKYKFNFVQANEGFSKSLAEFLSKLIFG